MPDFMSSILVFSVVISLFLFSWNSVQTNQQKFALEKEMRQDAHYTTTFLVSTHGYPENWNNSTVEIPGFVNNSDNLLSGDKLREFRDVSYDRQKALLGGEDFYLSFRNSTAVMHLDSEDLEYGEKPESASTIVPIKRNVLVNKSGTVVDAEMKYLVYR